MSTLTFFSFLFKIVPILNMRTTRHQKKSMNVLLIKFRIDNTYTSELTVISTYLISDWSKTRYILHTYQYRGKIYDMSTLTGR